MNEFISSDAMKLEITAQIADIQDPLEDIIVSKNGTSASDDPIMTSDGTQLEAGVYYVCDGNTPGAQQLADGKFVIGLDGPVGALKISLDSNADPLVQSLTGVIDQEKRTITALQRAGK